MKHPGEKTQLKVTCLVHVLSLQLYSLKFHLVQSLELSLLHYHDDSEKPLFRLGSICFSVR